MAQCPTCKKEGYEAPKTGGREERRDPQIVGPKFQELCYALLADPKCPETEREFFEKLSRKSEISARVYGRFSVMHNQIKGKYPPWNWDEPEKPACITNESIDGIPF